MSWFRSDITKTVTSDGSQVTFKVTYPSLRPNEYGSDSKRDDISDKFIKRARDEVREYLKKKDPNSYPSVDEKNVRRMGKGNVNDNTKLLDKIAYASLSKYSMLFKNGTKDEKVPTNNGKINILHNLISGNQQTTKSGPTGGWHKNNSAIGNDEVTVTFEFDFSKVHENNDLLIWQGKASQPKQQSASSNYDPYATGPGRGDSGYDQNSHPSDVMPATSPAIPNPSPTTSSAMPNPSPAMPNPSSTMPTISAPAMPTTSSAMPSTSPSAYKGAEMSQQEAYWQTHSPADRYGGGKSTRRHRSNTHRRIKQKKRKTMKNQSRRRKNTRK